MGEWTLTTKGKKVHEGEELSPRIAQVLLRHYDERGIMKVINVNYRASGMPLLIMIIYTWNTIISCDEEKEKHGY